MKGSHVSEKLSAYCHGELPEAESRDVAEHLMGCQRCRQEFEEIKFGVKLAEQLPIVNAPASLWNEIEAARASSSTSAQPRLSYPFFGWKTWATACAALVLLAVIGIWYYARQNTVTPQVADTSTVQTTKDEAVAQQPAAPDTGQNPNAPDTNQQASNENKNNEAVTIKPNVREDNKGVQAWEVARIEGAPKVGANRIEGSGRLAVGEWLETDHSSRAKINVADIGQVDIWPNSRVRLVETSPTEHRLAMARGRLHAMINAPPRLFFVDTPSAVAVDLGCSYTLEVDDRGRSVLQVMTGWVALERAGREAIVPAGAECVTEPGTGPGTPYFTDATPKFRDALARFDFQNGGGQALSLVLKEARPYDTLTLWHLLTRTRGAERARVYDRLAALIAPPKGVTKEGVMKLNKRMLERWKQELELSWFG